MPPAKLYLRFTRGAQTNLRQVLAYTEKTWGADQSGVYEDELFASLELLREHPEIGSARPSLTQGCCAHPVKCHMIYYRVIDNTLEVLRILHSRQITAGQFDELD